MGCVRRNLYQQYSSMYVATRSHVGIHTNHDGVKHTLHYRNYFKTNFTIQKYW